MKVSIVKCSDYEHSADSVRKALELIGGIGTCVKYGQKVLIKPNQLTAKSPEKAVTTHPRVVEAVILEVKKAGGLPFVGDSPALSSLEKVAEKSGILQVCKEHDVELVDLSIGTEKNINGHEAKSLVLANGLKNIDVIINLPKLKTHSLAVMTGAVKNLYGLIPGKRKGLYHLKYQDGYRFSEMLMDLYLHVKPHLTIMDAVIGMEGNGPAAGDPRKIGLIIAGDDALCVDRVASEILGMTKEIPLMHIAKARKLPQAVLTSIDMSGESVESVRIKKFKRPSGMSGSIMNRVPNFIRNILSARPFVNSKRCIKCGQCHDVCPAGAIIMKPFPVFDYKKCIRCYCCQEVCPRKAITLKKKLM